MQHEAQPVDEDEVERICGQLRKEARQWRLRSESRSAAGSHRKWWRKLADLMDGADALILRLASRPTQGRDDGEEDAPPSWALEAARQRAVALFQAYARGVTGRHGRSEEQFISDVNMFSKQMTEAVRGLPTSSTQGRKVREALETTHRLISEFALSGFTDRKIGERLFENQGRIYAALSTPLDPPDDASFEAGCIRGLELARAIAGRIENDATCPVASIHDAIDNLIQSSQGGG